MITTCDDSIRETTISQIKSILSMLPEDSVIINFKNNDNEYAIEIHPQVPDRCPLWLGVSNYGTFGLCFGHGFSFEELSITVFPPANVIMAILGGHVHEIRWSICGWMVKAIGEITLSDGRVLVDKEFSLLMSLSRFSKRTDLFYKPYPMSENK